MTVDEQVRVTSGMVVLYAPLWRRMVASLIDLPCAVVALFLAALPVTMSLALLSAVFGLPEAGAEPVGGALVLLGPLLYFALLESSTGQATIGKKLLGIYVATTSLGRPTLGTASRRFLAKWLSLYPRRCRFVSCPAA